MKKQSTTIIGFDTKATYRDCLSSSLSKFHILSIVKNLQKSGILIIPKPNIQKNKTTKLNNFQFNYPHQETHCFRGYPIYGSFKQFIEAEAKYILHLDSDMMFYEDQNFLGLIKALYNGG